MSTAATKSTPPSLIFTLSVENAEVYSSLASYQQFRNEQIQLIFDYLALTLNRSLQQLSKSFVAKPLPIPEDATLFKQQDNVLLCVSNEQLILVDLAAKCNIQFFALVRDDKFQDVAFATMSRHTNTPLFVQNKNEIYSVVATNPQGGFYPFSHYLTYFIAKWEISEDNLLRMTRFEPILSNSRGILDLLIAQANGTNMVSFLDFDSHLDRIVLGHERDGVVLISPKDLHPVCRIYTSLLAPNFIQMLPLPEDRAGCYAHVMRHDGSSEIIHCARNKNPVPKIICSSTSNPPFHIASTTKTLHIAQPKNAKMAHPTTELLSCNIGEGSTTLKWYTDCEYHGMTATSEGALWVLSKNISSPSTIETTHCIRRHNISTGESLATLTTTSTTSMSGVYGNLSSVVVHTAHGFFYIDLTFDPLAKILNRG